jgi:histidyl-tRNA synthetase
VRGKVELYPDAKVAKQFQHADKRGIPFAVGEQEIAGNTFSLKI